MSALALAMRRPSARGGSSHAVLRLTRAATRAQRGALAQSGNRVKARKPLRLALAEAHRLGAVLLAERARRKLVATG